MRSKQIFNRMGNVKNYQNSKPDMYLKSLKLVDFFTKYPRFYYFVYISIFIYINIYLCKLTYLISIIFRFC